jgi:hypothetical protein
MITIHNYEAFALDYIEGELSLVEMQEMEVLLSQNPDLRAEFATLTENWSLLHLEADETVVYANAHQLLQPLSPFLGITSAPQATRLPVFRYARIAAVAVGLLIFGGALYQIVPNISPNNAQNSVAQTKNQTNTPKNATNDKGINTQKSDAKMPIAAVENTVLETKNNLQKSEKVVDIAPQKTLGNRIENKKEIENIDNNGAVLKNIFENKTKNSQHFAYHGAEKTKENKVLKSVIVENKIIDDKNNNEIVTTNIENKKENTQLKSVFETSERATIAAIEPLETAKVSDFYFETDDMPQRIFMLSQNKTYLASTQTLKKRRQPLEAFLPEGTAKSERDGSIWKAFLPESAKDNSVNFAAIAETFRPSR